ncbi:MAG TPA: hypothetical protein DCP06_03440 [Lachnospiraceae bacterium]|nr:hypothetical protein [Lachnospiraceae bacterium]
MMSFDESRRHIPPPFPAECPPLISPASSPVSSLMMRVVPALTSKTLPVALPDSEIISMSLPFRSIVCVRPSLRTTVSERVTELSSIISSSDAIRDTKESKEASLNVVAASALMGTLTTPSIPKALCNVSMVAAAKAVILFVFILFIAHVPP